MAGKTARANKKREERYKVHPTRLAANTERRRRRHIKALEKKIRKFARYVTEGKMTQAAYEKAKARMEKEISYTTGDLQRGAAIYKKPRKQEE